MKNLYSFWDSKNCFIISLLFLIPSYAQIPESGQDVLKKIAEKEHRTYNKMKSSEYTMTSIQEMFDAKYYSLDLVPDPTAETLRGTVEIVCEVLSVSLDSVELNFWDGMTITDIHLSNLPDGQLLYSRANDLLSIALDSTFSQGEQIALTISYHGSPQNAGDGTFTFDTYNGEPLIMAMVDRNPTWWPCKYVLSDKADSVDIKISVPSELIVVSNGSLRETTIQGDTTTYWWHEQYPIGIYLTSFVIYPYTVYYDNYYYNNGVDTMKIHFYMFPDHYNQFYYYNAKVRDMITVFAGLFGEYPFVTEKFAIAEVFTDFVAFSTQTYSSIQYTYYNNDPFWTEWIINHELSHQWWGNSISIASFHHTWLDEGFATYSSAFWYEYLDGLGAVNDYMMNVVLYRGPGTVYVEDPDNDNPYDENLSYKKAAWVLHMLRHTVTDTVFFEILKTYASSPLHQYGSATTEDFQAICEQVSGMNLQKFFQQWIYQEYYPFYEYSWIASPDSTGFRIDLKIDQVQQNRVAQKAPLYWMPIDVKITTNSSDTIFVVWDSLMTQSFEFYLDDEPLAMELDPDNWILKRSEERPSGIAQQTDLTVKKFILYQNYPNPFNPLTTIKYDLPKPADVRIEVFNITGQKIRTLLNRKMAAGSHQVEFNAYNLSSGVYYYRIEAGEFQDVKKMILLR